MRMDYYSNQIELAIPGAKVDVTGDGSKFEARIISADFAGENMLKRHKRIYAALGEHIRSGAIHALTIKAYTPEEWEAANQAD